ncbi:MAG: ABC transporter permease [Candidatus Omnitrophica bacterium]|nr:ABC transporter permease [Candidatus Omnitrophota bacterium]
MWQSTSRKLWQLFGKLGPVFALVLVIVIFGWEKPELFFSFQNVSNVIGQTTVIAIAAIGMTFVIVSAGIDLSVGSVVALAGVYATMVMSADYLGWGLWYGLLAGLLTGAVCGWINGVVITKGKLAPFIVTLGMMEIVRGLALHSVGGLPVTNIPSQFGNIANSVMEIPLKVSVEFSEEELNMKALSNRIKSGHDPLAVHLRNSLSPETLQQIEAWNSTAEVPEKIQTGLTDDFNKIIRQDLLYTPERFEGIVLSSGVQDSVVQNLQGSDLIHLNRLLLEEAYPNFIAKGDKILLLPYSLFILIPLALVSAFILRYTVFGVQVYAVGSNERTARLCGVNVERVKVFVYMIGGFTAGLAGILHASRLNTGQPAEAIGMELEVIAAVVIGGGSFMGGEGTIFGSVIGAFIIKFLRNGCNILGISSFVQRIVIGLIIIAAVYVDQLRRRSLEGSKGQ